MKKIPDKIITGFFVFVFGIAWFCTTNYRVKQKPYRIIAYDVFGNQTNLEVRNEFQNNKEAVSFVKEYQNNFPHLNFSIQRDFPDIQRKSVFEKIFQQNHK